VSDLLVNELVAALFTEFDETTPQNVPHGRQAISLIFNDHNPGVGCASSFFAATTLPRNRTRKLE